MASVSKGHNGRRHARARGVKGGSADAHRVKLEASQHTRGTSDPQGTPRPRASWVVPQPSLARDNLRPPWDSHVLLDQIMLCGTSGSVLEYSGAWGIATWMCDLLLTSIMGRDTSPDVIKAFQLAMLTTRLDLVFPLVFCHAPGTPELTRVLVQYSRSPQRVVVFLTHTSQIALTFAMRHGPDGKAESRREDRMFPSLDHVWGAIRQLWLES